MRAALWLALWLSGWIPSRLSFSWLQASLLVSVTWRKPVHLYPQRQWKKQIWIVIVCSVCCASAQALDYKALNQFRQMILCVMPDSSPVFDYADYGCYCGYGGSGTPVDDLDRSRFIQPYTPPPQKTIFSSLSLKRALFDFLTRRCCQVHDACYSDAMQHPECWPILDNPYTEFYSYSCDEQSKTVTCGSEYSKTTRSHGRGSYLQTCYPACWLAEMPFSFNNTFTDLRLQSRGMVTVLHRSLSSSVSSRQQ